MINAIFSQFVEATPITVMVRGIMERIFEPTALDELFEAHAVKQYTRELLFSNVVSLMSLVVSGIGSSVSAAYKALEKDLGVSRPALYGKLNGMERTRMRPSRLATICATRCGVSQALVRYSASNLESLICELKVNTTQLLTGVAFNILSTVKAALQSVHGVGKVEAGLSDYYLVEEVQATYRGMAIALPTPVWSPLVQMSLTEFAQTLKQWASFLDLKRFCSSPRQKKKPKLKPTYDPKHPHRSTARLLQQQKQYKRSRQTGVEVRGKR